MDADVKFNLQQFLSEMREEQREEHVALSAKIDAIRADLSNHETRIVVVEGTRKGALWLGSGLVLGAVTFFFDLFKNHVK